MIDNSKNEEREVLENVVKQLAELQKKTEEFSAWKSAKEGQQLYAHAKIANNEMGDIKVSMIQISTDVDWLKRSYWVVATASFGGLIGAVINLLAK